ncbi:ABC transporter ATP-binding protein [Breznakiella homolactica]|uniref:ABC transporter ATP-binding protein n=1 Tax=Breznakiella homolactica TaxID=2798577 RepID=A0A7T7XQ47_9SPIR|nr:ABC transporter ATP-binding protein [Breznakiella homolactica]QQO10435.1 ABC transporter ATP-binding protein [Breznakiella homolactica]
MSEKLLEIKNLSVEYRTEEGVVNAVNGLSLSIDKGETMGLVGETGAGKTTTALSAIRLVPNPPGVITAGEIIFHDEDLMKVKEEKMRSIRGNRISVIFQDPMTTLNPVLSVSFQIEEALILHQKLSKDEARKRAVSMLNLVGIRSERAKDYPHEFSGGMRQRVGIAMALACNPELLIADEPTTALDVTIQAQVLDLMRKLKEEFSTSLLLITHDLGIVAETCDRVAIMYAGEVIELADVESLFNNPKHPYTIGLLESIPSLDEEVSRLKPIEGLMPDPTDLPSGCKFHPRCPKAMPVCSEHCPGTTAITGSHDVSCFLYSEKSRDTGGQSEPRSGT